METADTTGNDVSPVLRWWVYGTVGLTGLVAFSIVFSGLGTRLGFWHFRTGIGLLRWSVTLGLGVLVAAVISTGWTFFQGDWGIRRSALSLILLVVVLAIPLNYWWRLSALPTMNDITTAPTDPPRYQVLRAPGDNSESGVPYSEATYVRKQIEAYPEVRPVRLHAKPARALELVEFTAGKLGWEVVSVEPDRGLLEAIDRTFWLGFTDEIVVRVRARNGSSRIDVRSRSRVGKHDFGKNARRIKRFLYQLQRQSEIQAEFLARPRRPGQT